MIAKGDLTIDELVAWCNAQQATAVSRSAMGRYVQSFEDVARELRLVREMSLAMKSELEDVPDADGGRLIIESLQALLLRVRMQIANGDEISPEDLNYLTRSAKDLASAMKSNVDTEIKVRDRVAREAATLVDKAEAAAAKTGGLTTEGIAKLKAEILGLRRA